MWKAGTKLRRFAVIAATVSLLMSGWFYWDREPRYQGVPASSHILHLIGPVSLPGKSPYDGIREMGSEIAVPALIRVIEVQDSTLDRWYEVFYSKIPANLRKSLPAPRDRDRVVATALTALAQFGAEASPSVPTLINIYDRNKSRVISTLSAIGQSASNAIPTLLFGLHPTNTLCFATASALWRIDPDGDLIEGAFAKDPTSGALQIAVRDFGLQKPGSPSPFTGAYSDWGALEMLGCARSEAKQTAPFVAEFLHHEKERIRAKAAEALGRLGPVVQEYAERIRPLLRDDWQMVREAATNALVAIESKQP